MNRRTARPLIAFAMAIGCFGLALVAPDATTTNIACILGVVCLVCWAIILWAQQR